jgi:hypothetical protein
MLFDELSENGLTICIGSSLVHVSFGSLLLSSSSDRIHIRNNWCQPLWTIPTITITTLNRLCMVVCIIQLSQEDVVVGDGGRGFGSNNKKRKCVREDG